MPTNTYGPNDNYNLQNSHFIPALIKKIHIAKKNNNKFITLWGDGKNKREVLYVDDLADAIVYFLNKKTKDHLINIGSGFEKTIIQYVKLISEILGHKINIRFEKKKLKGTPRKLLNINLAKKYGWKSKTNFKDSIIKTYKSFLKIDKKC